MRPEPVTPMVCSRGCSSVVTRSGARGALVSQVRVPARVQARVPAPGRDPTSVDIGSIREVSRGLHVVRSAVQTPRSACWCHAHRPGPAHETWVEGGGRPEEHSVEVKGPEMLGPRWGPGGARSEVEVRLFAQAA